MGETTFETIIKTKFSSHRGEPSLGVEENSLAAISAAFALKPPFIEFDIVAAPDGIIRTGHPPQRPMDPLDEVLELFRDQSPYPKIDIKPTAEKEFRDTIDKTLNIVISKKLPMTLITLERGDMPLGEYLSLQRHLAERVREDPHIRLSIDITRFDGMEGKAVIEEHMQALEGTIATVAAKIYENDFDIVGRFTAKYGVENIEFGFWGLPVGSNPSVSEQVIREALELEERYGVTVYFDINRRYVLPAPTKAEE